MTARDKATIKSYFNAGDVPTEQQYADLIDSYQDYGTGGGLNKGTSFPGSPSAGDLYFRTDLGLLCYYDGSRWLTVNEYSTQIPYISFSTSNNAYIGSIRTDGRPYFTRISFSKYISTPNDVDNCWYIDILGYNDTLVSSSYIDRHTTENDTSNSWIKINRTPNTSSMPTYYSAVTLSLTKAGSPGDLRLFGTVYYRLIIT